MEEEDSQRLRESAAESDMIRGFKARNLTELDKRCWLSEEDLVTINQGRIWALRNGQIVYVDWKGKTGGSWRRHGGVFAFDF